jgi:hypothetical protein
VLTTLLKVRTLLQHPGVSVPLLVMHGTRFKPTYPHVIAAEASETSSTTNKSTTRTCLFVRSSITQSFSKALVGAALPWEMSLARVTCVCLVWVERMRKLQSV